MSSENEALLRLQQRLVEFFADGPLNIGLVNHGVLRVRIVYPGSSRIITVNLSPRILPSPYEIGMFSGDQLEFIDYSHSFDDLLHDIAFNFMTEMYSDNLFDHVIKVVYGGVPVKWQDNTIISFMKHHLAGGETAVRQLQVDGELSVLNTVDSGLLRLMRFGRIDVNDVPMFLYGLPRSDT